MMGLTAEVRLDPPRLILIVRFEPGTPRLSRWKKGNIFAPRPSRGRAPCAVASLARSSPRPDDVPKLTSPPTPTSPSRSRRRLRTRRRSSAPSAASRSATTPTSPRTTRASKSFTRSRRRTECSPAPTSPTSSSHRTRSGTPTTGDGRTGTRAPRTASRESTPSRRGEGWAKKRGGLAWASSFGPWRARRRGGNVESSSR